jgi:glycosyltransferase involved in cell wall biosynthesis
MKKKKICLNMIVKDESQVIQRCLESVKKLIDYWVIVDTGSTDGTQEIIEEFLKDVPGILYERPWVNFAHNRNEAMRLASRKADYLLLIDADDRLVFSEDFVLPALEDDAYCILQKESFQSVFREHHVFLLIKNDEDFEWEGVLHEYLKCEKKKKITFLADVFNEYICDGNRSKDPDKIDKDIHLLKQSIEEDPKNSRSIFYLARTYWSMRDYASALPYFEKRAVMGGDPMEIYYSLLFVGIARRYLNYPPEVIIQSLSDAYLYRPSRSEAIYELARYYADSENFLLGFLISKFILTIPKSNDTLFVEPWVNDWGALLYFFVCANQIGRFADAWEALQELRANPRLPDSIREEFKLEEWNSRGLAMLQNAVPIVASV